MCWLSLTVPVGQPAHCYRQLMQVPVSCARGIEIGFKARAIFFSFYFLFFFLGLQSETVEINLFLQKRFVFYEI